MEISRRIEELLEYGLKNNILNEEDINYSRNKILDILNIEDYEIKEYNLDLSKYKYPIEILEDIVKYGIENRIIEDIEYQKQNLIAKLMDSIMPRPSTVNDNFKKLYLKNKRLAFKNFYDFSKKTNYIQMDRIDKNIKYNFKSKYGNLEISINLSKPEKDPKEIEKLKNLKINNNYPKTPLAKENEGFFATLKKDARQNLRIINMDINNEKWHFQYSPYIYYDEHSILFSDEIRPMKIDENTFKVLFEFLDKVPEYFIGSNADLPIVGGSILNHDHYQAGKYTFPMELAEDKYKIKQTKFNDMEISILKWPLNVIRIRTKNKEDLIKLSNEILENFKKYSDESQDIISKTDEILHNTITPIARKKEELYEIDLVLRNNRTTPLKPYGIFHPREEYHNIKKENIGLIEVMGLAILPGRLKKEMEEINQILRATLSLEDAISMMNENDILKKHSKFIEKYFDREFMEDDYMDSLYQYIGDVFEKVLEDCKVFRNEQSLIKFIEKIISRI